MVCPVCDAEVHDRDVETCLECETPLATWEECHLESFSRPLFRCRRCGECPSSGDRACRQCDAHFLKCAPAWLDAEFPGWVESDELDPDTTFICISCDVKVALGQAQCGTCGLRFCRPTENSSVFLEPDPETETVPVPAAAPTLKIVTVPTPAMNQPTVGSVRNPARRAHASGGKAAVIAARIIPPRARLVAERQASYKALLASGSIRPVPGVKWLSGQAVVCAHGHRSHFGLFACLPGYGTLDSLPDFKEFGGHNRLAAALHVRSGTARDNINDRDPERDVRWQLGCPTCGTDLYTFEAKALQEYAMCTASPDLFWVFCHLYRRDTGMCGNCEIRRVYWDALRSLE